MQAIQPGQAARRDSADSRCRESGDGGGAASAPSKRQALLPGDGGMEEDQPPGLGTLATGVGFETAPLAGDAAGGGGGGGPWWSRHMHSLVAGRQQASLPLSRSPPPPPHATTQ